MLITNTGQPDRTIADNSFPTNSREYSQDVDNTRLTRDFSLLNTTIVKGHIQFPKVLIHQDCPPVALKRIEELLENTVRVLSIHHPNIPCMIFCGARDKWGYARARPPYKLLKDDASWLAYRFIYKYLFMPDGIPKKTSEGKDLDIHHTCGRGRQGCIQPAHLTPLDADTNKELGDMDYAIC